MKEIKSYNAITINGIWVISTLVILIISVLGFFLFFNHINFVIPAHGNKFVLLYSVITAAIGLNTMTVTIGLLFVLPLCIPCWIIVQPNENIVLIF